MQSLLILGRQPAIGLAELESLYGSEALRPVGQQAAIVDVDPCLLTFDRLGGSVKFCKVLTSLKSTDWKVIEKFLIQVSPEHSKEMPEGKMQLGLSVQGIRVGLKQLEASGLSLKKAIRKTGRSVRLIPNKELELNSAQVLHNHLTGPTGWELVIVRDGDSTVIAQTVKVQDITSYTLRDRERPKRDSRVGMLPPKLAQIIINLAVGKLAPETLHSICEVPATQTQPRPVLGETILDPFCGTGVILQEALLMGYSVYGTDLEPRMVEYSRQNLAWLAEQYSITTDQMTLEQADATSYHWTQKFDFIASEVYLGRPFTHPPSSDILIQTINDCNLILTQFLKNLFKQLQPGSRLCLAIPAWQTKPGQFRHLPLIDQIENLGYNRVSFEHVSKEQLLYYRPDQIVARELIVLARHQPIIQAR